MEKLKTQQEVTAPYNLKISEKEKYANDGEWFKKYMRYIVSGTLTEVPDYESMKLSYEVANNNLEGYKDKIQQFCNPLGESIGEVEEELVPYPELHNKINVLKGELIKRNDDHKIVLLSAKAIKDKNAKLYEAIRTSVDEKLAIELEKQKAKMSGMKPKEVEEYIASLRTQLEPEDLMNKNWMSEVEIFNSRALKYCMQDQDIKMKKMDSFEDVIVADRCFIFSGWKHGRPHIEIRNPLFCGFHKSPNERFVEKGDYFWYRKAVTPAEIFNNYNLTDEQIRELGLNSYRTGMIDRRHAVGLPDNRPVFDQTNYEMLEETTNSEKRSFRKDIGLSQTSGTALNRERHLVWETHFEFKAFKQINFLSYTDEYNSEIVITVNEDFEYPDYATKEKFINRYGEQSERWVWFDEIMGTEFSLEKLWIPRKYEIVRLGNYNVFPIFREVPYQYTNIENPYSNFELSTKGAVFSARNTKSVSLLQRALAPYFQLLYLKHVQNRELAKYQGAIQSVDLDQIPDSLGEDIYGNPIRDKFATWLAMVKKTNKDVYSGSQSSLGGLPPSTRSPGSNGYLIGTAVELMNLQQMIEFVKREIGMAMGLSPQREAAFSEGTNVSDNRQAITQSHHITEPYFFVHSQIWKSVLNDWLTNFRMYCRRIFESNPKMTDYSIHYFLPDGTEELLKVTPESISHNDVGIFLINSGQIETYTNYMLQLAHAFAQNAGEGTSVVSSLLMDITSGASPQEIHKKIQIAEQRQHERMMQLEQQKQQSAMQLQQKEIESREDIQIHEIDKIVVKGEIDKEIALLKDNEEVTNDDSTNEIDYIKVDQEQQKIELKKKEMQDKKELAEEKLQIDRKKASQPKTKKQ